jgi:hypothetical protein
MIKIIIVVEQEDGIDFRAYSLQISNKHADLSPDVRLGSMETNRESGANDAVTGQPSLTRFDGGCHFPWPQPGRTLETQQIFMN